MLAGLLLSRLAAQRHGELAAIDLDAVLAAQHALGAERWPTVVLAPGTYVEHVARCLHARSEERADAVLRALPAADLYLATACASNAPGAASAFREAFAPMLRQALGKLAMSDAAKDEAIQRVMVTLLVGDGGTLRIGGYAGRGPLGGWVRTVGVRTARRVIETERSDGASDAELAALPAEIVDPALELVRGRYTGQVREALVAAFAQLADRQREVLRLYYFDALTIDELGELYAVNRATAARWVAAARLAVVSAARGFLTERLAVSPAELDSILRVVRSQIRVSVRDL